MPASAGAAGPTAREQRAQLLDLLEPLVTAAGYDLDDITVTAAGRRNLVRVIVDADGGIDLDAVARVSRIVSDALDAALEGTGAGTAAGRALAGSYVLEVSSPGVDRPLTEPRHWRRAIGRLVTADAAGRALTGRVTAADEHGVTLDVDGRGRTVAYADLGRGRVQIEFNRGDAEEGH